jgi:uncharacterized protein
MKGSRGAMTDAKRNIDVDVHHSYARASDLAAYLPRRWQELLGGSTNSANPVFVHHTAAGPGSIARIDALPSDGTLAGSSLSMLRAQLLEPMNIGRAILTFNTGQEVGHENVHLAVASATALNDWSLDTWVRSADDRLYGAAIVSTLDPQAAAAEIRRIADEPRIVTVLFVDAGIGPPYGHPVYHPIYDAASEVGLPISIHFGYNYTSGHLSAAAAGGSPMNFMEYYAVNHQAGAAHVASFVTHGVFEKWPSLQVVMLEDGFVWVPWLFERLDRQYDLLRRETPWVKRLPSEYLRDHLRFSTQPFEYDRAVTRSQFVGLLDVCEHISDVLMFASDYPHWDADSADRVSRYLPSEWRSKVFVENALGTYRWPESGRGADVGEDRVAHAH